MTKLPTLRGPGQADRLKSLDDGIARLRAATGKPERRVIFRVCSITGKGFSIAYERIDPRQTFKFVAIEKASPTDGAATSSPTVGQKLGRMPAADPGVFSANEFDNSSLACPWCGSAKGQVYHNRCGTNYCGGARTGIPSGSERFACPACRESFDLVNTDEVHGTTAAPRHEAGQGGSLIEQAKRALLPRWPK